MQGKIHPKLTLKEAETMAVTILKQFISIDYGIDPGSFPNLVAELECVTLPWRLLQEA